MYTFLCLIFLVPIIIFPGLFILLLRPREEGVEIFGRETTVSVPLCACEACARDLHRPRRSNTSLFLAALATIALAAVVATLSLLVGIVVGVVSLLVLLVGVARRRSSAVKRWQRNLKDKLGRVPVYAQLLCEYPHSVAVLPAWMWLNRRPWSMSS